VTSITSTKQEDNIVTQIAGVSNNVVAFRPPPHKTKRPKIDGIFIISAALAAFRVMFHLPKMQV
jgi:hypothetical protein